MNTLSYNILESQFGVNYYHATKENEIIDFLASKNIEVVKQEEQLKELSPEIKDLSMFMGKNYKSIKKIYDIFKNNLYPVKTFSVSRENFSREQREMAMIFMHKLHAAKAISGYYISANKKNLIVTPIKSFTTCNILTGHWFEYYIREQILAAVKDNLPGLDFACASNLSIRLSNGKYAEIDMMMRVNGEYFLIEAKSGKLNGGIGKFYRLMNDLRIKARNAFIIMAEGAQQVLNTCSRSLEFKIADFENFISNFSDYLNKIALMTAAARKNVFIAA